MLKCSSVTRRLMGAALALFAVCAGSMTADARVRHHRIRLSSHTVHHTRVRGDDSETSGRYAAFVVDAKTGRVLYAKNADAPRHPASLTKMMTLYVLFEELEKGRFSLSSRFRVSQHASSQNPTKLGLRPGDEIEAGDAILGLVTQSANDAAVTIAENISGSEEAFARRMTQTARRLGMNGTLFRNASGLPNDEQITTARDIVTLGRALQERFPEHYKVFATRSFAYRGRVFGNHNHLLGRMDGIDGIKTGYTQASGYNLVSSLRRDGRHIVASVLGGSSGAARDARMANLLSTYIESASTGPRVASVFTEAKMAAREGDEKPTAPIKVDKSLRPTPVAEVQAPPPMPAPAPLIAPARVTQTEVLAPAVEMPLPKRTAKPRMAVAEGHLQPPPPPIDDKPAAQPEAPRKPVVVASTDLASIPSARPKANDEAQDPSRGRPDKRKAAEKEGNDRTVTASIEPSHPAEATKPHGGKDGWLIQIGATASVTDAKALLSRAQAQVGSRLNGASAVTETVTKGSSTLYRARFAGFTAKEAADAACNALKHKDFACLVMRQ